ncbi:hypothetical protein IFM89_017960 [Coptis chinensis]|uniref:Non-haem dioxygenase N-terminal domain-containing protein n=1 Tax=Coptis chinensis TaxID=261450 RepID=A0A835LUP0_9MAGN|nr:hypothetical protein IFM89_017960 [Coptis chinensis]
MATSNEAVLPLVISSQSNYDRVEELKAFDETKAGVKGLVDAGLAKVPRIFIRPPNEVNPMSDIDLTDFRIPVIDLQGTHQKIVNEIENASENWGFFQVVNHGVPLSVLEEMIKACYYIGQCFV